MDTGGGMAGGLARGLRSGLEIGSGLEEKAERSKEREQDVAMRQQEFGLQKRGADRLDRQEQMENTKLRLKLLEDHINDLQERGAGAAQANGLESPEAKAYQQQIEAARAEYQAQTDRLVAPQVYDGVQQAQRDASDLRDGKVQPTDLGPQRFSRVVGLTGHPPIAFVNGHDHNGDGEDEEHGPITAAINDVHMHANNGNLAGAQQAAWPLLAPYTSMHPPGHDLHSPGLNTPYADSSLPPPNLGAAQGNPATPVNSALASPDLNATPGATPMSGATDPGAPPQTSMPAGSPAGPPPQTSMPAGAPHIGAALNTIGALGTMAHAASSDPTTKQLLIDGHQQGATDEFYNARQFLMRTGGMKQIQQYMLPDELDKRFLAYKNELINEGVPAAKAAVQAREEIFTPQIVAERLRVGAEAGLRKAQIDEANARVQWMQSAHGATYTGSDGQNYVQESPGVYTEVTSGDPMPAGVSITGQIGRGRSPGSGKDDVYEQWKADHGAWVKDPHSAAKKGPAPSLPEYRKKAAAPAPSAAPGPGGPAPTRQPPAPGPTLAPAPAAAGSAPSYLINPATGKPYGVQ